MRQVLEVQLPTNGSLLQQIMRLISLQLLEQGPKRPPLARLLTVLAPPITGELPPQPMGLMPVQRRLR